MARSLSRAQPMEVFLSYSTTPSKLLYSKKSLLLWQQVTFLSFSHSSFLQISDIFKRLFQESSSSCLTTLPINLSLMIFTPQILFASAFQLRCPDQSYKFWEKVILAISSKTMPKVNNAADSAVQCVFYPMQKRSDGLWYFLFLVCRPKLLMKKLQPQKPQVLQQMFSGQILKYSLLDLPLSRKKSAICQKKATSQSAQNFQFEDLLAQMSQLRVISYPIPCVSQKMVNQKQVLFVFLVVMKAGRMRLGSEAE